MAYQGEDLIFSLKGDDVVNLDAVDFKVLVYPCGKTEESTVVEKSQCTQLEANHYEGKVAYTETKNMATGQYALEVLIIGDGQERSVFKQNAAFYLEPSASKNIE